MKALVIDGTRFVGAHVVIRLVDAGHDVTVLHRGITTHPALPKVRHVRDASADHPITAFPTEISE